MSGRRFSQINTEHFGIGKPSCRLFALSFLFLSFVHTRSRLCIAVGLHTPFTCHFYSITVFTFYYTWRDACLYLLHQYTHWKFLLRYIPQSRRNFNAILSLAIIFFITVPCYLYYSTFCYSSLLPLVDYFLLRYLEYGIFDTVTFIIELCHLYYSTLLSIL